MHANRQMLTTMMSYRSELNDSIQLRAALVQLMFTSTASFSFNYRIKLEHSMMLKMGWYDRKRESFNVQKSFNDLLGARLIIPSFRKHELAILDYFKSKEDNMIRRPYIREEFSYHGLHLSLSSTNFEFPWELQIWDTADREVNFKAHARHEARKEE